MDSIIFLWKFVKPLLHTVFLTVIYLFIYLLCQGVSMVYAGLGALLFMVVSPFYYFSFVAQTKNINFSKNMHTIEKSNRQLNYSWFQSLGILHKQR